MTATLPTQTTAEHIDKILNLLGSKPGWVDSTTIKTNLGAAGDSRKLNALHYVGVIERDGTNAKLSEAGREIARASDQKREDLFAARLGETPIYFNTLDWIYWQEMEGPTKVDVASHWIDTKAEGTEGAADGLISDGAICFFRMAEYGGLGKFINAGKGREARFDVDRARLGSLVAGAQDDEKSDGSQPADHPTAAALGEQSAPQATQPGHQRVTLEPGVRVNIEIHIAADATPDTIEEIFKNMRAYVLNDPESEDKSG